VLLPVGDWFSQTFFSNAKIKCGIIKLKWNRDDQILHFSSHLKHIDSRDIFDFIVGIFGVEYYECAKTTAQNLEIEFPHSHKDHARDIRLTQQHFCLPSTSHWYLEKFFLIFEKLQAAAEN
jgi:hypothetical protein